MDTKTKGAISDAQKFEIMHRLSKLINKYGSQNRTAESLHGVSSATISQIINENWNLINEKMWRNVGWQVGWTNREPWKNGETALYQKLEKVLQDAKMYSNIHALTAEAGTGKTHTFKEFTLCTPETFLLQCNEFWNRKAFMGELLKAMGRDSSGATLNEMMHEIVTQLKVMDSPVIIMDEFDKVSDSVLFFFITLYNYLEDHCGLVMAATDHLQKRIKRGLQNNRKGYKEIYSRIGRRFIELPRITKRDIHAICNANGINNQKIIDEIHKASQFDLRKTKKIIQAMNRA